VDGRTWQSYKQNLEVNLAELHSRIHRGTYRALPSRRRYYLHYVFDLWAGQWRKRHARGRVIIVRFADGIIIGFEHEGEVRRFLADMRRRLEKFALSLHRDKTRLIEFGRYAAEHRARRGLGKPETFNFLGFTHICGRSSRGVFQVKRSRQRTLTQTRASM
jgi:RNA-directed DNA polymerase